MRPNGANTLIIESVTFLFVEHSTGSVWERQGSEGPGRAPPSGQSGQWPSQYGHHTAAPSRRWANIYSIQMSIVKCKKKKCLSEAWAFGWFLHFFWSFKCAFQLWGFACTHTQWSTEYRNMHMLTHQPQEHKTDSGMSFTLQCSLQYHYNLYWLYPTQTHTHRNRCS